MPGVVAGSFGRESDGEHRLFSKCVRLRIVFKKKSNKLDKVIADSMDHREVRSDFYPRSSMRFRNNIIANLGDLENNTNKQKSLKR